MLQFIFHSTFFLPFTDDRKFCGWIKEWAVPCRRRKENRLCISFIVKYDQQATVNYTFIYKCGWSDSEISGKKLFQRCKVQGHKSFFNDSNVELINCSFSASEFEQDWKVMHEYLITRTSQLLISCLALFAIFFICQVTTFAVSSSHFESLLCLDLNFMFFFLNVVIWRNFHPSSLKKNVNINF